MQRPEQFRTFAQLLLAPHEQSPLAIEEGQEPALNSQAPPEPQTATSAATDDELALMRELRLFHAKMIESVEAAVESLVEEIASEIVARELLLEPADIDAIVDRALQRFTAEEPLRVRVHSSEAAIVACSVPVCSDETLRPGDAVVELRTGSVDARLGVRLAALLQGQGA